VSAVVHAVLITAMVYATLGAKEALEEMVEDTTLVFITPPQPDEPPPPPPPEEQIATLMPPPKGFQTVVPPSEIPTEIPKIDLTQHFDPRDYSGKGTEGGVARGVEGGTGPVDLNATFLEAVVEERPQALSCPPPAYPRILQDAGIEGRVLLEFVIDTLGHAERSSIKVIDTANQGFNRPAIDGITKCVFRPGRVAGHAVRVLVRMPVVFGIIR
jgi:protein TonB